MAIAEELRVQIKVEVDNALKNLNKVEQQTGKTKKGFLAMIPGPLKAAAAIAGVVKVSKELINAFTIQEEAEASLNAALKATGDFSESTAQELQDFAAELQGVTTYGDEATLSAMGLLQSLGDLGSDGLQAVMPLIQDFATGMGVDLNTAASLVGKTLGSSTNALSRYGVEIDATLPKEEKLEALTAALEEKFGGMSEEMAKTASGSLKQFKNALGDVKEAAGQALLEGLQPMLEGLTGFVTRTLQAWDAQRKLNKAMKGEADDLETAQRAYTEVSESLEKSRERLRSYNEQLESVGQLHPQAEASLRGLIAAEKDSIASKENQLMTISQMMRKLEMEEEVINAVTVALDDLGKSTDDASGKNDDAIDYVETLTAGYRQYEDTVETGAKAILAAEEAIREIRKQKAAELEEQIEREKELRQEVSDYIIDSAWNVANTLADTYAANNEESTRAARIQAGISKAESLYQVAISTITAATKALELGPIAGPIAAGVISAIGAANAAAIVAEPMPALAEGGIVTKPTTALIGEAGPEAVIPLGKGGMGTTVNVYNMGTAIMQEQFENSVVAAVARGNRGY